MTKKKDPVEKTEKKEPKVKAEKLKLNKVPGKYLKFNEILKGEN